MMMMILEGISANNEVILKALFLAFEVSYDI